MASQQPRKSQSEAEERDEDQNEQGSQEDGLSFLRTAREMVAKAKTRRDTQRKTIKEEHAKRVKEVSSMINGLFETRKNRVTKIQKTQWDRLDALNKKRSALELQIISRMKAIELHTFNISGELSAMLEGRMEEAQNPQAA